MNRFRRFIAALLAVCLTQLGMIQSAQATLIGTEEVARVHSIAEHAASAHARLNAALARSDVQAALERLGVSKDAALERIAALTDDEATLLAERIDSAPAGAGVLGAIVFVFLVLLVTDILGFTKIYPFTRSIR